MSHFESYEKRFGRKCDFIVEYDFILDQEDYVVTLSQGMRSDFCYEKDYRPGPVYMIWPEFESENGEVIDDTEVEVSDHGRARMWVMLEEQRPMHKDRLTLGLKGYFVAGSHKIVEAKVVEIVSLKCNP